MVYVGDLRLGNLGLGRARVVEELVHLVRADIRRECRHIAPGSRTSPAARLSRLRPRRALERSGAAQYDRLDNSADRSCLNQLAGLDRSLHLQPLAVHDGVDFLCLGDGLANRRQIFEGGDTRLVAQKVFTVLHGANADAGAVRWRSANSAQAEWKDR